MADEPKEVVKDSGEQATPTSDSTPEKTKSEAADKPEGKPEEKPEAPKAPEAKAGTDSEPNPFEDPKEDSKKPEEEKPADETKPDAKPDEQPKDQPQGKADSRKQQLNTEIRDLVAQRNTLKQEVEKLNDQVYRPQTVDELVAEGMSPADARIAAMEQRQELKDYNDKVVENQLVLSSESQKVLSEFPMFNPTLPNGEENPEFRKELAAQAARLLEANLIKDPNTGQIIGSNVSPYELYKTIADASRQGGVEGQIKGQRAAEGMLSRTEAPSSSPPQVKEDPLMAGLTSDD